MPFVKRGTLTSVGKKYAFASCGQSPERESVYIPATADLLNNGSFNQFQSGQNVIMLCDTQDVHTNERSQKCQYIALSIVLWDEVKIVCGEVISAQLSGSVRVSISAKDLGLQPRRLSIFLSSSAIRYFLNDRNNRTVEYKAKLEVGDRVTIGVIPQPDYNGCGWTAAEVIEMPQLSGNRTDCSGEAELPSSPCRVSAFESNYSSPMGGSTSDVSSSNGQTTSGSVSISDNGWVAPYTTEYQEDFPSLAPSTESSNTPNITTAPPTATVNVSHPQQPPHHPVRLVSGPPPPPGLPIPPQQMYYSNQQYLPYYGQAVQYVVPAVSMTSSPVPPPPTSTLTSMSMSMGKEKTPASSVHSSNGSEQGASMSNDVKNETDNREKKSMTSVEKRMLKWMTTDIDCLISITKKNPELFKEWSAWFNSCGDD